ncbi:hypothetical protein [Mycobacterium haemophilum]|nr:hypothetical protein [Mycobacterium haemophilum]
MRLMSETSETPTTATAIATPPPAAEAAPYKTPKVFQAAAWVAIVAGIVFIVAVIFFSGYSLGRHAGHHGGFHHGHHKQHAMVIHPRAPIGGPAATPGGGLTPLRPGAPGQVPSSVAPSATTAP